jgi:6-phosphogluconate dehydrogenase
MAGPAADLALVGLARLGQNLILSLADQGYDVVAYNRTTEKVDEFLRGAAAGRPNVVGARSVAEMVGLLSPPRTVLLAVAAGRATDELVEELVPHLEPGDLIVDAGNSHFADTTRRAQRLEEEGMLFVGAGFSSGGRDARDGPAIVAGGSADAWPRIRDLLLSIAARSPDGQPCCSWVGEGGAGHFVKMVHNGIEYADMQLVCEAYQLLRDGLGLSAAEMQRVFAEWNRGELDSYLISITADILAVEDEDGAPLVDKILDAADQQGTGTWTVTSSLELGVPATLVAEAVHARSLSAMKDERVAAARVLNGPPGSIEDGNDALVDDLRDAMLATRAVSYTQAFMLMRKAAAEYGWPLDAGAIAATWQGSIIRSALLTTVRTAFDTDPDLGSVLLGDTSSALVDRCQPAWRRVVATAVGLGIPVPAISGGLAFYDGYRTARLPANLLQAQRDYFAAHTYERIDRERGLGFHTDWAAGSTSPGPS